VGDCSGVNPEGCDALLCILSPCPLVSRTAGGVSALLLEWKSDQAHRWRAENRHSGVNGETRQQLQEKKVS